MLKKFLPPLLFFAVCVLCVVLWEKAHPPGARPLREALPITHMVLANGLEVIVVENHRVPAVSHMLFVRAGGADDPPGKSGIAHYVEHMMFKGTKTVGEAEYDRRINALGGENNAYTTSDFTTFYVNAPASALEQVMALESDRLMNLEVNAEEAKTELKVVQEERHMRVDSDPSSILNEQMDAVQFLMHPYRIPVIGWPQDIAGLTAEDVVAFINAHYKPTNMVLIVAGDATPKQVQRLAMRYYGGLRKESAEKRAWPSEPPAIAARSVSYADARVKQPQWVRSYVATSMGTGEAKDSVALELVSQWLGGGRTGLLYQSLVVEKQLAIDIGTDYSGSRVGPGIFTVRAIPKDGVSMEQLAAGVDATLKQALATGPSAGALERAKTLYDADIVYAQDGLTPIASYIGTLEMLGKNEEFFYGLEAMVDSVTAADMQRVAGATLTPENAVTGTLTGKEEAKP